MSLEILADPLFSKMETFVAGLKNANERKV
jgi:hypothetical protein